MAWVNEAGVVNRAEVRELADIYLGRFDERMERRFAEQDVRLERQLVGIEQQMTAGFAAVRVEMADRLSAQHRDLLRWLFVFWAGTIIPPAVLLIALIKL